MVCIAVARLNTCLKKIEGSWPYVISFRMICCKNILLILTSAAILLNFLRNIIHMLKAKVVECLLTRETGFKPLVGQNNTSRHRLATNATLHCVPWCKLRQWAVPTRYTLTDIASSIIKILIFDNAYAARN